MHEVLIVFLILYGLFTLYGAIFQPDFYWERGRIKRGRQLFGDKPTRIIYITLGAIMVLASVLGFLGRL